MKLKIQLKGRQADPEGGGEKFGRPVTFSMALHGVFFGVVLLSSWATPQRVQWGDEGIGGTAVAVNLTPTVPLPPRTGPQNPLASDTRELYPAQPQRPEPTPPPPPPRPSARELQLAEREAKKRQADLDRRRLERELAAMKQRELPEGAIPGTTTSGRAASDMYGMATAHGAGGLGFSGDFGSRYGWYVRAVRECLGRNWDRSRIDASVRQAPRVFVEFQIMRDGIIRNERIVTRSNVPSVDREALRTVHACSGRSEVGASGKLPELPRDYRGSSVTVELWFEFTQ
jgi:outer membrane biosynthesis protein TonB